MGVTTTADEKIQNAREDVKSAIKNLHTALDPETWGSDEYTSERDDELLDIYKTLLDVRKKL